ncbi:MAG: aminotransferase class I/II-fold pyridoxal phosphate-dependent enzyme [Bacteroidetes bacterium]|nr:aminotransferase class I/II-fold pyridoxal phosphate-dependent enzyme [Bacteroidota bacterium]
METPEFRLWAHKFADWMADYYENIEDLPVKSMVCPGEILSKLPELPPEGGESMSQLFEDFQSIILPGMTHWQSPNFFAYFPANGSLPSILAEMLTAAMGAQCMIWETSPAAAELEERVMDWLKVMTGLPSGWSGVIQDTASTATLAAILSAREKCGFFSSNETGLSQHQQLRVYCSTETHSSIDKAVKIAGIGRQNLVKVIIDKQFRMDSEALRSAIQSDIELGFKPCCVVATLGTTSSVSIDPLKEIAEVCKELGVWLHVDAAYAGSALLLPEFRWMIEGIDQVDSFVFNPHKWLFTNFDCSAYFVKDKESLIKTFEILPEYLKTGTRGLVNDYRDWGVPLGRRFRALKLWFVIRSYGVEGLKEAIRNHIEYACWFETQVAESLEFEIMATRHLSVVCFRFHPKHKDDQAELDRLNATLLEAINRSGKAYLTHTKLNGQYVMRMAIAQTRVKRENVQNTWELIKRIASEL